MRFHASLAAAIFLLFAFSFASQPLPAQSLSSDIAPADAAFQAGEFPQAEKWDRFRGSMPGDSTWAPSSATISSALTRLLSTSPVCRSSFRVSSSKDER